MRSLITILCAAAAIYLLLGTLLYLFQERLVFLPGVPGRELTASPADRGFAHEDVWLTTADGVRLHAWYVPARDARGVVLFFHGNAGNISHRLDSIGIFRELGLDTLIVDYRGYGRSAGTPTETGLNLDAEAAWGYLTGERNIDPSRIIVFGRSLGAAVAAWTSARFQPAGTILESGFSSAMAMARRLYPLLPVRLITRLHFPVNEYVAHINSPLLVIHSRDDEIIPFAMAGQIVGAAAGPTTLLELRGDHNSGFMVSRERYVRGLRRFVARTLPGQPDLKEHN